MLSRVIAPSSRPSAAPDQEQRQRPVFVARPPRPVDPVAEGSRDRWSGDQLGSQGLRKLSPCCRSCAQATWSPISGSRRFSRAVSIGGDALRRKPQHVRAQAASRLASSAWPGAACTGPRRARAGWARPASPSAKVRRSSEVTASIRAMVSSIVGNPAPDAQHPREPLGARRGALQPHQQAGLELRPRSLDLGGREAVDRAAQFVHREFGELADLVRAGAGVEGDEAGVLVGAGLGEDRVAEAAPLAQLLEQPRRHARRRARSRRSARHRRRRRGRPAPRRRAPGAPARGRGTRAARRRAKRAAATPSRGRRPRCPNSRSTSARMRSGSTAPAAAMIIRSGP